MTATTEAQKSLHGMMAIFPVSLVQKYALLVHYMKLNEFLETIMIYNKETVLMLTIL